MDTQRIQKIAWDVSALWAILGLIGMLYKVETPIIDEAWYISISFWLIMVIYNKLIKK